MPPRSPISKPGRLGQSGIRADAEREDHEVGGILLPGFGLDFELAFFHLREAGHSVIEREVNAMPCQMAFGEVRHLAVHGSEDLVEHFDESDIEPKMARFSAISSPMKPPPTTTACRTGFSA